MVEQGPITLPPPLAAAMPLAAPDLAADTIVAVAHGWQAWVAIGPRQVLKVPKSLTEIMSVILAQRGIAGKPDLDPQIWAPRLRQAYFDGERLVRKSTAPPASLGNPVFFGEGRYLQRRVIPIDRLLRRLSRSGHDGAMVEVLEGVVRTIVQLWRHGIHDSSFNFTRNFGVAPDGTVVLMDFGECAAGLEDVAAALRSQSWRSSWSTMRALTPELRAVFLDLADTAFSETALRREWGRS